MAQSAPTPSIQERYVVVYGTLRRSGSNDINLRKPAPRYVGTASLTGTLFDLGPYPGLILGSAEEVPEVVVTVVGEVYAIAPALEDNLDELEGLLPVPTGEYIKRVLPLKVHVADKSTPAASERAPQEVLCIVYEINPVRTHGCMRIGSGDWIAHWAQKRASALAGI